jgi:hypothetical protein
MVNSNWYKMNSCELIACIHTLIERVENEKRARGIEQRERDGK